MPIFSKAIAEARRLLLRPAMPIKSLIIDDDPFIHTLLMDKLEQHFPEVEVLQTGSSGTEGIDLIRQLQPNLVFLDVEMTDMTGFEMLSQLDQIDFQTIFITSYTHYAIKAIRFNALDYILKPIDLGELKQAIKRFTKRANPALNQNRIQQALHNFKAASPSEEVLTLHLQDGELRLPVKDIVQIRGERNYSYISLQNASKKLASKTLGDFEDLLSDKGFFRCHKSHLINGLHIQSLLNKTSLQLSDANIVPISRRKKEAFDSWYAAREH